MKTYQYLKKARELISNPMNWIQGSWKDGASFCAIGAVREATAADFHARGFAIEALATALPKSPYTSVISFNDAPERTHQEVLALFDRAIKKARVKGYVLKGREMYVVRSESAPIGDEGFHYTFNRENAHVFGTLKEAKRACRARNKAFSALRKLKVVAILAKDGD